MSTFRELIMKRFNCCKTIVDDIMNYNRIKFDERWDSNEYSIVILYFIAPKKMLKRYLPEEDFPEAVGMEIAMEFPTGYIEPKYAIVGVSPTREDIDGALEDYDWYDVELPYDEIEELISLAERSVIYKRIVNV